VYADGQLLTTLRGEHVAEEFLALLEQYVAARFGSPSPLPSRE